MTTTHLKAFLGSFSRIVQVGGAHPGVGFAINLDVPSPSGDLKGIGRD